MSKLLPGITDPIVTVPRYSQTAEARAAFRGMLKGQTSNVAVSHAKVSDITFSETKDNFWGRWPE